MERSYPDMEFFDRCKLPEVVSAAHQVRIVLFRPELYCSNFLEE